MAYWAPRMTKSWVGGAGGGCGPDSLFYSQGTESMLLAG